VPCMTADIAWKGVDPCCVSNRWHPPDRACAGHNASVSVLCISLHLRWDYCRCDDARLTAKSV
jgi:hypothetical protein